MYRILQNIYVGPSSSTGFAREFGFSILGAAKYPFHKQHAKLLGASKEGYLKISNAEPEYYFAERDHALYCNLIDARLADDIPDIIIDRALRFIQEELAQGRKVYVTCNQGMSRSPSIVLMYLIKCGYFDSCNDFDDDVFKWFKAIYPLYAPNSGFYEYTKKFFEKHKQEVRKDGEEPK